MIYLDNASTTFPKPEAVPQAVYRYMTAQGANINRGCYDSAYDVEELVFETRQMLCDLFHGGDCKNVVFTKNVTESLNVILKGFLKSGDHVLLSSMEHNAMMRPIRQLEAQGVEILTCGTCLDYYGLTEKLRVGTVTNMYTIVEKLAGAGKVVKP